MDKEQRKMLAEVLISFVEDVAEKSKNGTATQEQLQAMSWVASGLLSC